MAPQRYSSVRHKPRSSVRLAWDDSGLIAVRYEQTKQAEPPIPLPPPRNPLRTTTTSTSTTTPVLTRRLSSTGAVIPVTIVPPPVPPPQEEHPLFRSQQPASPETQADEWKRDSGLAPSSSSATLREEYEDVVYQKILDDIADAPSVYSGDEEQSPTSDAPSPIFDERDPTPAPLNILRSVPQSPVTPVSPAESPLEPLAVSSPTPTRASSLTSKLGLGKSFSIRSAGKRRLQKKTRSVDNFHFDTAATKDMDRVTSSNVGRSPNTQRSKSPPRAARPTDSAEDKETTAGQSQAMDSDFTPITTSIPEESLWDDFNNLSFSKRGSLMFGGKSDPLALFSMAHPGDMPVTPPRKVPETATDTVPTASAAATTDPTPAPGPGSAVATTRSDDATPDKPGSNVIQKSPSVPSIRVVSMDVERESQKVRSLYESGESLNWQDGGRGSYCERLEPTTEVPSDEEENVVYGFSFDRSSAYGFASPSTKTQSDTPPPDGDPSPIRSSLATTARPGSSSSLRRDRLEKGYERAGGLEDWEDVEGRDVDRYGFINQRRPGSATTAETPERSSQLTPNKKRNVLTKRPGSGYGGSPYGLRPPSRKVSARSLNTFASEISTSSRRSTRSSIRSATNRLPHNRDRRWMDEASDMLALQPGLTDIAEETKEGKAADTMRRKEAERTEKWRKMAKVIKQGEDNGHGMDFEFDTKNPKLIDRTWKGIPDCWRGAAWHSFLVTSAKRWKSTETDEQLMAEFRKLQDVSSPDDVQIDLDVPRTINGHIMFRKRYRGGQRLLFRVLHAISLYFPETGYVQGMASLAATLLCYYDEERCFVMMVRLWRFRGLERLYQPGFAGLMATLGDFEKRWLAGKDVADKLNELSIDATAYGTRWYLTLFNLSIPFPAQLRVWDVFMLLGECPPESSSTTEPPPSSLGDQTKAAEGGSTSSPGPTTTNGLDVLHATSAALIHALRDVLLDSDFENAMKALTAWIPVKDEDLLMKVARAEWKLHQNGNKKKEKDRVRGAG
ncbi:USP6 N-terminal-like protein [Podospora aff. communis PSN243]|uniref:USP6 N-terminal-like protein n=1 Tax=Podospora aff. communis PSN243 TaxID=3040156 RepID=A0AAV9H626_9PEZI|nr:USP6 N-terminal-like protein [Podospora aff. communis PSN243]